MVYTINLKSGTFRGDYGPWEVTFRKNVQSRRKSGVSGCQNGVRGSRPGAGPGVRGGPGGSQTFAG